MSGLYVKVQVDLSLDPKVIDLSESAELMYRRGLEVAKRLLTDGFLKTNHMQYVCHRDSLARAPEVAAELVAAGLWEALPGGWRIVAWLKHNKPAEEVKRVSELRQQAGAKGQAALRANIAKQAGQVAGQFAGQNGEAVAGQNALYSVSVSGSTAVTPGAPARVANSVPPSEPVVAVPDAADDEPAFVSDWAPDDPTYEPDPHYTAQAELELWEARVGPIQPRDAMMSATALIRLHLHCKRSVREIRALIEHVAADPDARKWWGAGKSPARWLSSRDGGEPTWCKVRAHWQGAGGKLHGNGKIRRIEMPPGPAPAVDPACDCRRGFITVDGHREGCPKCSRGQHIRAGGRL